MRTWRNIPLLLCLAVLLTPGACRNRLTAEVVREKVEAFDRAVADGSWFSLLLQISRDASIRTLVQGEVGIEPVEMTRREFVGGLRCLVVRGLKPNYVRGDVQVTVAPDGRSARATSTVYIPEAGGRARQVFRLEYRGLGLVITSLRVHTLDEDEAGTAGGLELPLLD